MVLRYRNEMFRYMSHHFWRLAFSRTAEGRERLSFEVPSCGLELPHVLGDGASPTEGFSSDRLVLEEGCRQCDASTSRNFVPLKIWRLRADDPALR